jgi:hypothetical protein
LGYAPPPSALRSTRTAPSQLALYPTAPPPQAEVPTGPLMVVSAHKGQIVHATSQLGTMLGYSRRHLEGMALGSIVPPPYSQLLAHPGFLKVRGRAACSMPACVCVLVCVPCGAYMCMRVCIHARMCVCVCLCVCVCVCVSRVRTHAQLYNPILNTSVPHRRCELGWWKPGLSSS